MKNHTEQLIQACIKELQQITVTLSGDDFGLTNCWEEICVQMQGEESFFWEQYIDTIDATIDESLKKLGYTYPIVFYFEQSEIDKEYREDEFEDYKTEVRNLILEKAGQYSNANIRKHFNY